MSYCDISDKLESMQEHLRCGSQVLSSLSSFIGSVRSATDHYSNALSKSVEAFSSDLSGLKNLDTLSAGLSAFTNVIRKNIAQHVDLSHNLQKEILVPVENFTDSFNKTYCEQVKTALVHRDRIQKLKKNVGGLQKRYFYAAAKTDRSEITARDKYVQSVDSFNISLQDYEKQMSKIMRGIQRREKERIEVVKESLEKFTQFNQVLLLHQSMQFDELVGTLGNINSSLDIRVFVDMNKSNCDLREEFLAYEDWKKSDEDLVSRVLEYLIDSCASDTEASLSSVEFSEPSPSDYGKLTTLFASQSGRDLFVDMLYYKKKKHSLPNEKLTKLSEIVNRLLAHLKYTEYENNIRVLLISMALQNEKKRHLYHLIQHHPLWQDPNLWIFAIERSVKDKLESEKETNGRLRSKGLFTNIKEVFSWNSWDQKAARGATYTIASQFIQYMNRMNVPLDMGISIIRTVSKNVRLDADRICCLLSEIHLSQFRPQKLNWHKRSHKCPIGTALKFLETSDLFNVLLVCKEWNSKYRHHVLSIVLPRFREQCWENLLIPHSGSVQYETLINSELTCDLASIIEMDAVRSYRSIPDISSDNLIRILKSVAIYSPEIGYCQGMNYIAGTFYLQLKNEQRAFECMLGLFSRYDMKDLFIRDLPKLRQFFYQLDRLIALQLPLVHASFVEVGLSSGHFAASWFITIFASTLQARQETLLRIWDLFISKGWKTVFKAALAILHNLSEDIVEHSFDEIMLKIGSLSNEKVQGTVFDDFFIEKLSSFPVSNRLLDNLKGEYFRLKELSKQ